MLQNRVEKVSAVAVAPRLNADIAESTITRYNPINITQQTENAFIEMDFFLTGQSNGEQ